MNFWWPGIHVKQNIFEKSFEKLSKASLQFWYLLQPNLLKNSSLQYQKIFSSSKYWFWLSLQRPNAGRVIDQFGQKKVPKEALFNGQHIFVKFISKIFCLKWTESHPILFNFIRMLFLRVSVKSGQKPCLSQIKIMTFSFSGTSSRSWGQRCDQNDASTGSKASWKSFTYFRI